MEGPTLTKKIPVCAKTGSGTRLLLCCTIASLPVLNLYCTACERFHLISERLLLWTTSAQNTVC